MADNTTVSTFENEMELTIGVRYHLLILGVIPVWILLGNFLVLTAVLRQKSLRTLCNWVIASLAFTDFLLALFVVPLGIYQLVVGQWKLGLYVCLLWTGSDVVLSTASIMHLGAIAIYRYNGIAHPLRVRSTHEMRHVAALVLPAWLIAVTLSIPYAVQGATNENHVLLDISGTNSGVVMCGIFNQTFAIYSSLVSFFLPLAVMIFADIRSIQILRRNVNFPIVPLNLKRHRKRKRERFLLTTVETDVDGETSPRVVTADRRQSLHHDNTTHFELSSRSSESMTRQSGAADDGIELSDTDEIASLRGNKKMDAQQSVPFVYRGRSKSRSVIYISMLASHGGSIKVNGRERRAERTLIWVFVSFVGLWLPFFCVNLTYGLCSGCGIPPSVFTVFTWLGYLSSGVNPCIYTYLNKDFRNAFKNILTCGRKFRHKRSFIQYS